MFPGPDKNNDVAEAVKLGVFNANTSIHAVERNKQLHSKITKSLNVFKKVSLAETFKGAAYANVDYAFLDFCGQFTYELKQELETFFRVGCVDGARVSLTFSTNIRNNKFLQNYWGFFDSQSPTLNKVRRKYGEFVATCFAPYYELSKEDTKTICALASVLPRQSSVEWVYKYKDAKTPMLLLNVVIKNGNTVRSSAAHKAWETRRVNAA